MIKPTVSIIIPIYNKEKYLNNCISSIKNQSLKDIEVICVDDGSTDDSLSTLKSYTSDDSRFKIIKQENRGPGLARNVGLENATGEYVLFLDADDWIESESLEQLYKQATSNNSDLVLFNSIEHYPDNYLRKRIYVVSNDIKNYDNFTFNCLYNKRLVMNSYFIVCTKLHKLDFLRKNNIKFQEDVLFEDVLFHIKTMIKANNISYNPQFFYHYMRTDNSRQNTSIQTSKSFVLFDIFNEVKTFLKKNKLMNEFKLNFLEFNITEIENIYKTLDNESKDELFLIAKNYFNNMNISNNDVKQLPDKNRFFYNTIKHSKNSVEFNIANTIRLGKIEHELIDKTKLNDMLKLIHEYDKEDMTSTLITIEALIHNNKKAYDEINKLNYLNESITSSTSWKITKPFRYITSIIRKIRNNRNNRTKTKTIEYIEEENNIFYNIFKKIENNQIRYDELLNDINNKWYRPTKKLDTKLTTQTVFDLVNNNVYDETFNNENILLKYENILFREIVNDVTKSDINILAFNKINSYNLFDEEYYKEKYNYKLHINPLLHYIYIGYLEGKNPNENFDGNYYKKFNKNAGKSELNPLVYLVLNGFDEGLVKTNESSWQPLTINRKNIEEKIRTFNDIGITTTKRKQKIIISLTTYPERINNIQYTIYSLLTQTLKADEIILWLSDDEFPNKEENILSNILKLKKNGLTIKWCKNIKSYKKLIPALQEYSNDIIITADDDIYYPENWLKILYETHKQHPENIIAHRSKKITLNDKKEISSYNNWQIIKENNNASYLNFFTTGGGTLFPPHSLNSEVFNEEEYTDLTPYSDDIWFWAMAILNKTKIEVPPNNIARITYTTPERDVLNNVNTLWYYNKKHNDKQLHNILNKYPEIKELLYDSLKE